MRQILGLLTLGVVVSCSNPQGPDVGGKNYLLVDSPVTVLSGGGLTITIDSQLHLSETGEFEEVTTVRREGQGLVSETFRHDGRWTVGGNQLQLEIDGELFMRFEVRNQGDFLILTEHYPLEPTLSKFVPRTYVWESALDLQ